MDRYTDTGWQELGMAGTRGVGVTMKGQPREVFVVLKKFCVLIVVPVTQICTG